MFLLNSRLRRFTATSIAGGTPSPEVTELICLVPEQPITRAPENTHLVYLCRFVVQVRCFSLEAFPGTRAGGFALPALTQPARHPSDDASSVVRPPFGLKRTCVVPEY